MKGYTTFLNAKKLNFIKNKRFLKSCFTISLSTQKIFNRASAIPLLFLKNKYFLNKNTFSVKLLVTRNLVGYKFGEFSLTRKPFSFPKKKKKR